MRKIPSLYERNHDGDRLVRDEIVPGSEWVLSGEGVATRKWDGTCCLIRDGKLYKRYDAKPGRTPPPDFEPAMDADPITGHQTGWVPVTERPEDRWHREAFGVVPHVPDGTYELCGPRVNGNPEGFAEHVLVPHGVELVDVPTPIAFGSLRGFLADQPIEGIVWHHPDGSMVKIKTRDFGLKRPRNRACVPQVEQLT